MQKRNLFLRSKHRGNLLLSMALLAVISTAFAQDDKSSVQDAKSLDKDEKASKDDWVVNPLLEDRFMLEMGTFIPQKNIKLGADGSTPNDEIDLGGTFDFKDNENTFFFHFEWRFAKKWKLGFETFTVNNGNSVILDRDIEFQDFVLEEGTFARAGLEFNVYRIFFGRKIISNQKHLLGAGLGFHAMNIALFLEGEFKTSEGDQEFDRRRVSALIPLPNVGAWYGFAPHRKWMFGARVDWFGITINQYSGSLWNIAPQVKFQIIENLGIGFDYRTFLVNAKVNEEKWKGSFDMNFSGPLITLHGNF